MTKLPLKGLIVLEFSQYLSGPSAGLRLADLGARVIKIERPDGGDPCRKLSIKNLWVGDDSLVFHTINRNKESFTADLKNKEDLELVKKLLAKADVAMHNFRPGIMEKIGLAYADVKKINERIIYAEITGFGKKGPWKNRPGQDLLLQSLSGLTFATGNRDDAPMPFGLSVADSMCGIHIVQAILAALIRRQKNNKGAYVELSLLESVIGLQFELFTTFFHSQEGIQRSVTNNGHPLLGAPYGIYKTRNGFIALAMMDLQQLGKALGNEYLQNCVQEDAFKKRDAIKTVIAGVLAGKESEYWISRLKEQGLWASEVFDWNRLTQEEGYFVSGMEQPVKISEGIVTTTRCPLVINGEKLYSDKSAPVLGADKERIIQQLVIK